VLARHTLRAAATQERRPAGALRWLNRAILRHGEDGRFCTAAYVRLVPIENGAQVTVASGGHPPPLVLRADGTVLEVACEGTVIGIFSEIELTERLVELHAGDTLLLYTDGVTEAGTPTALFGQERLERLLASCVGLDAAGLVARVERGLLDFQAGAARDDVALMALRLHR
jgi:serine phosphatase RsbU (regulator of sigma subunit)